MNEVYCRICGDICTETIKCRCGDCNTGVFVDELEDVTELRKTIRYLVQVLEECPPPPTLMPSRALNAWYDGPRADVLNRLKGKKDAKTDDRS